MARKYGKSWVSRWDDDDFKALTSSQQGLYDALSTHPDISWCGVLPLVPARFVDLASDYTEPRVRSLIKSLDKARFLVVDPRTGELCVRTFIRWDEVLKVPNVTKAMGRAFYLVHSQRIQEAILIELARDLDEFPEMAGWPALEASYPELMQLVRLTLDGIPSGKGLANPSANPSGEGSGKGSGNGSRNTPNTPQPLSPSTPNGNPPLASLVDPPDEPASVPRRGTRLPDEFTPSLESRTTITSDFPGLNLRIEHAKFVDYWHAKPGKDGVKLDWDATWRNWMRKAGQDLAKHTPRGRQQQVDDHFARSMARAEALEAGQAATIRGELA